MSDRQTSSPVLPLNLSSPLCRTPANIPPAPLKLPSPSLLPFPNPYPPTESPSAQTLISILNLSPTLKAATLSKSTVIPSSRIPSFLVLTDPNLLKPPKPPQTANRSASTTIFYPLSPHSPVGSFHRNKGRTIHTLHRRRRTYVVIHADEVGAEGGAARVETFTVGGHLEKGERLQWVV